MNYFYKKGELNMANSYDKNEIIKSKDKNFENLRKNLDDFIKKSTRQNPIGTQGLQNIPNKANVASSVTETQFTKVNNNPMTNAINLIYNIVHNGYMKHEGYTTQNTKINNTGSKSKNDKIPALTDYYQIVNYWSGGTSSGNLSNNSSRCNGACTGFCVGTCYGDTSKDLSGTQKGHSNPGCGEVSCGDSCTIDCIGGARNYNAGYGSVYHTAGNGEYCASCLVVCGNGCGVGCGGDCYDECSNVNCLEGCSSCTGCSTGCGGECKGGCKDRCTNDCDTNCKSNCTNGCGSYCAGNCIISCSGSSK